VKPENYPFEMLPLSAEDGGGFLVIFPDLPGCLSDGDTPEEALHNGFDAARSWLLTAREFGDAIPQPGYWVGPRLLSRLPKELERQLAEQADERGVDREALATMLIAEGLAKYEVSPVI
jgi:antitoxin HicB